MTHGEKALALHAKRLNCCQSVFLAFRDVTGLDEQAAMNMTAGFGGGMQTGETCGAVVGALLVLGSCHTFDSDDPEGENGKAVAGEMAIAFQEQFKTRFRHCRCENLLRDCYIQEGCVNATTIMQADGEGYCDILIETAVELVEDMIARQKDKISMRKADVTLIS